MCADADSQLDFLPGLGCLNYPSAIGPIVENPPNFIRSKWEKRVVQYAEDHNDAYPGFKEFAAIIQEQARLKNHPNVLACTQSNHHKQRARDRKPHNSDKPEEDADPNRRVLKSSMESGNITKKNAKEEKFCAFHQRKGHLLTECKAFENEPLEAKNDCILRAGLCFRCLSRGHRSNECTAAVKCAKCGDDRHPTILHREREQKPREKNTGRRFEQPVPPFVRTQTAPESRVAKLCSLMSSWRMERKNPTAFMQL